MPSILDYYMTRPTTTIFQHMKLLHFAQSYNMPHRNISEPSKRRRKNIVIVRPYYSPDPNGPNFEQYCCQKLMLHKPFRHLDELKADFSSFTEAYQDFLQSDTVPPSLEDDVGRLQQHHQPTDDDKNEDEVSLLYIITVYMYIRSYNIYNLFFLRHYFQTVTYMSVHTVDEWMLICQRTVDLHNDLVLQNEVFTSTFTYPNIEELPSFITRHRQSTPQI